MESKAGSAIAVQGAADKLMPGDLSAQSIAATAAACLKPPMPSKPLYVRIEDFATSTGGILDKQWGREGTRP